MTTTGGRVRLTLFVMKRFVEGEFWRAMFAISNSLFDIDENEGKKNNSRVKIDLTIPILFMIMMRLLVASFSRLKK